MDRTEDKKWDQGTGARVQERAQFYSLTLSQLTGMNLGAVEMREEKLRDIDRINLRRID